MLINNEKKIFIFLSDSPEELIQNLQTYSQEISNETDLILFMKEQLKIFQEHQKMAFRCVIIAQNLDAFIKESLRMVLGIKKSMDSGKPCKTPLGSYFTPKPLYEKNQNIVFVYPGVGGAYVGMAKKIIKVFPEALDSVRTFFEEEQSVISEDLLFSEFNMPSIKNLHYLTTGHSWLFTYILKDILNIKPSHAMGYSLGEVSMFLSLQGALDNSLRIKEFKKNQSSKASFDENMGFVRKYWESKELPVGDEKNIWNNYLIQNPVCDVEREICKFDRVYLMIINHNDECIIGGYPPECEKLLSLFDPKKVTLLPYKIVFHTPPCSQKTLDKIKEFCIQKLSKKFRNYQMYSSGTYQVIPQKLESVSQHIIKSLGNPLNFPKLVKTVYSNGGRIFVEVGPRNNCSHWIEKTLKNLDHVAIPLDIKGMDDWHCFLKALSTLIAHGVDLDLSCLDAIINTSLNVKPFHTQISETHHISPTNATEIGLVKIWSKVLDIDADMISIDHDFFDLGGHSLLATQVLSQIRSHFNVDVSFECFFSKSTVSALSEEIINSQRSKIPALKPISREEFTNLPVSYAQERVWFLHQFEKSSSIYNIPFGLRFKGAVDILSIQEALSKIISRHESLRTVFSFEDGQVFQKILEDVRIQIEEKDFSSLGEIKMKEFCEQEARRPFDLSKDLLVRAYVLKLSELESVLFLNMHHIITDGWSIGIFTKELSFFMNDSGDR